MKKLLPLGWIVPIIFILGSLTFGSFLQEYSFVSQTISEIGEMGSPFQKQWFFFDLSINILMFLFVTGLIRFAKANELSMIPCICLLVYSLANFGALIFVSPHPYHNIFGALNIVGYLSPLIFFIYWKNQIAATFRGISLFVFIILILGTVLNLNPIFDPLLFPMEYYGLAQRLVVFTFLLYCAYLSISAIKFSRI